MTEAKLVRKLVIELKRQHLPMRFIWWKSPSYKRMSWDIFNIYDILVVFSHGSVHLIQVTTLTNLSHRRRKIQKFFRDNNFIIPNSFIYAWDQKKEEFKIEEVNNYGF